MQVRTGDGYGDTGSDEDVNSLWEVEKRHGIRSEEVFKIFISIFIQWKSHVNDRVSNHHQ
jgi:hypothetical protein